MAFCFDEDVLCKTLRKSLSLPALHFGQRRVTATSTQPWNGCGASGQHERIIPGDGQEDAMPQPREKRVVFPPELSDVGQAKVYPRSPAPDKSRSTQPPTWAPCKPPRRASARRVSSAGSCPELCNVLPGGNGHLNPKDVAKFELRLTQPFSVNKAVVHDENGLSKDCAKEDDNVKVEHVKVENDNVKVEPDEAGMDIGPDVTLKRKCQDEGLLSCGGGPRLRGVRRQSDAAE